MVQEQQSVTKSGMSVELRKFEASEYERLTQIRNSLFPDDELSAAEMKSFDDNLDKTKYYFQRYSCFSKETGEIVGFGTIGHIPWMFDTGRYHGGIIVDKHYANRGIGQFIYDNLMKLLKERKASEVWGFTREDRPVALAFLANRGFKENFRTWESSLDPATVDTSKFTQYREKASKAGIQIRSLAEELELDPECYRKLYDLNQTLMADVPMPEPYTPLPFDQWLSFDMKDPGLIPEAYAIAKSGDLYVGLSTVRRLDKEPRGLHQQLTGVRREYRGKGVAFAMKLKVLEYAKRNGIEKIKTENATSNASMLALNLKLGFKKGVGLIAFSKTLT